eukprot:1158262-Pelagomonas_calceolata.AAC.11
MYPQAPLSRLHFVAYHLSNTTRPCKQRVLCALPCEAGTCIQEHCCIWQVTVALVASAWMPRADCAWHHFLKLTTLSVAVLIAACACAQRLSLMEVWVAGQEMTVGRRLFARAFGMKQWNRQRKAA